MSELTGRRALSATIRVVSICSIISLSPIGYAAIDGTDARAIDGTDAQGIDGTDARAIDGTDVWGIDGTDARGIDGTDARAIDGTDAWGIDGTDARAIDGTDAWGIDGTDARAIDGTDARGIDGTDLLALGQVGFVGEGFISVMGQTVFQDERHSIALGDTVAVYGTIDLDSGSIANATVVPVVDRGVSYLRGIVDSVDSGTGRAVVSGVTVDYTALLSSGVAPSVGDEVAVTGRSYSNLGLLVAQP